ncbi:sugar phosphate isomerase/epimerase family protein [Flexithrix dorotheae]|uniref:sugar phosphate isomerase/epimerase family protein n=1 Tax=Flexithrix dorotheae TaxID=70993 RepID=UPI00037E90A3|nr:sugar phosphate isomerase/epimerase [Flexithrix dorotheae]
MTKNIKLGVSTWLWTSPFNSETVELFPKIKEMGFDYVEIPVEDPDIIDAETVKKALTENNLKPIICGAFGPSRDLTSNEESIHENCFQYLEACFKLSQSLDAGFVAGPMYSAVGKTRLLPPEERKAEWNLAVKNLRKVCEMATKFDQKIALEPLNRFESDLVNTAEQVLNLVNDINHPAARIMLDSFHMTLEERNLQHAIELVGDKLIHFQVSENYRGAPGTGQTRWDDIKSGLENIQYSGVVSIESFTPHVQELAGAVCIWRNFHPSQDQFAKDGLTFLEGLLNSN